MTVRLCSIKNIRSAFFGFITKHARDRRTKRQTDRITTPETALASTAASRGKNHDIYNYDCLHDSAITVRALEPNLAVNCSSKRFPSIALLVCHFIDAASDCISDSTWHRSICQTLSNHSTRVRTSSSDRKHMSTWQRYDVIGQSDRKRGILVRNRTHCLCVRPYQNFYRATASSYASAVLAVVILFVRPSVTRLLCDKTTQCAADILIPHERAITLVFWHQQWLVGFSPQQQCYCQLLTYLTFRWNCW